MWGVPIAFKRRSGVAQQAQRGRGSVECAAAWGCNQGHVGCRAPLGRCEFYGTRHAQSMSAFEAHCIWCRMSVYMGEESLAAFSRLLVRWSAS